MCETTDIPGSESDDDIANEDPNYDPIVGWDDKTDSSKNLNDIRKANQKIRLLECLHGENLYPTKISSSPWSAPLTCPFHKGGKERHPSFGYNFVSDRFYCLACKRSGGAVQFLALKNNKSQEYVAHEILVKAGEESDDFEDLIPEDDSQKIDEALFELSGEIRKLTMEHKSDKVWLDNLNKVMFWFDNYLAAKVSDRKLDLQELLWCISRVRELI